MRLIKPILLTAGVAACATLGVLAHERLRVDEDTPLYWSNPASIGIVINSDGSDDVADDSDELALRMAIQDWNDAAGADLTLVEDTDPAQQARTDWAADNIHLIWFDETNSSGYFNGSSGTVAITPVWFFLNGQIVDADILFNGEDHQFTTSGEPGKFDIGDVGAHELGHLVGLDHSGWAGATMYPYVDPAVVLQRSLSLDEVAGARDIHSLTTWGSISGTVERSSDSSPVQGAHVVARDSAGRPASSVLTKSDGTFVIPGLDAGTYTVYADPLDAPVSAANLGGAVIETDFETTVSGTSAVVPAGGNFALGTISVGADVALNLGSNLDMFPLQGIQGQTIMYTVRGTNLSVGSTLTASDPDVVISSETWFGSFVTFQATFNAAEPTGHVDLIVNGTGGELNILPAAFEITPPNPTVTNTTPAVGPTGGGSALTITGTGFNPGARVVIGDQIYRDGEPGGCVVVNTTTITLTTLATADGVHDVVVVDPSGVDGRQTDGFEAALLPTITSVFPPSGDAAGGTEVILRGTDFIDGLAVRINGVTQTNVTWDDSTRVRVVTLPGTPGGPYTLEIENPGGGLASGAFVYVNQPDPVIDDFTPPSVSTAGGETVTITGSNFTSDSTVKFGVDADTGLGGEAAAGVVFIDSSTLEVTTPAHVKGTFAVMVQDASSSQATTRGGFKFSSGSSGGGGCAISPLSPPASGPRAIAMGGWWIALLFAASMMMRRRRGAAPLARVRK